MPKSIRIQLSRTKGFRLQEHSIAANGCAAVNVTRPGAWGNPFAVGEEGPFGRTAIDAEGAVGFFRSMLSDPEIRDAANYPSDLSPLRGKNLACWCSLDAPCHADVLLDIVNTEVSS